MKALQVFEVINDVQERDIALGLDPQQALEQWVRMAGPWKHQKQSINLKAKLSNLSSRKIQEKINQFGLTITPALAWRFGQDPCQHRFAANLTIAQELATKENLDPDTVRETDPLFVFMDTPIETLEQYVRMTWYFKNSHILLTDLQKCLPQLSLQMRTRPTHYQINNLNALLHRKQNRLAICAWLRLAMELPFVASQQHPKSGHVLPNWHQRTEWQMKPASQAFVQRHGPHIGHQNARQILTLGAEHLDQLPRTHERTRQAALRLLRSYGYHPDQFTWTEINALWSGGPNALKDAQSQVQLGLHDRFIP